MVDRRYGSKLVGMGVLSASGLMLEIVLIRVFSVLLPNHSAYAALGVALAGLGIGAALSIRHPRRSYGGLHLAAVLMIAVLLLTRWLPSFPSSLLYGSLWALPFVPVGAAAARLFAEMPSFSFQLYAVDMAGAAAGAVAAWGLLYAGPVAAIVGAAGLVFLAGEILMRVSTPGILRPAARFGVLLILIISAGAGIVSDAFRPLPIAPSPMKDQLRMTEATGGKRLLSRWSPFGRTDVIDEGSGTLGIFVDGAAGTVMLEGNRYADPVSREGMGLARSTGGVALRLTRDTQRDSILVIGAGGGRDVLMALQAGFRSVIAVEINPEIVRIDREMGTFNNGLFDDPRVSLVQKEGRSFTRSLALGSLDVIFLAIPLTKSSRAPYGYALTESYLVTVQSIQEYWDRLTEDGEIIVLGHGPEEMYRLMLASIRSLAQRGLDARDVLARTLVMSDPMHPAWILRRQPVPVEMAQVAHQILHSSPANFYTPASWIPGIPDIAVPMMHPDGTVMSHTMLDPVVGALAEGRLAPGLVGRVLGLEMEIPTDQRPFFYKEEAGLPGVVSRSLAFGLLLTVLLLALVLAGPGMRRSTWLERRGLARDYFAGSLIGAAYIMVEISVLQQFTLVVGHPAAATALLLPMMLAGSAAGALLVSRLQKGRSGLRRALLVAALTTSFAALIVPFLLNGIAGWEAIYRYAAASVATFLFAVPLGVPFPLLLNHAGTERTSSPGVAVIWTGNAVGSITGSALGLGVAVLLGLRWSLLGAGMLYATAAFLRLSRVLVPVPDVRRSSVFTGSSGPFHRGDARLGRGTGADLLATEGR